MKKSSFPSALMVLGTSSSAGKSLLVTALCRIYARRGLRVAPFKAQNMSNNAAVCAGGEIGRAQAVQAHAAGIEPTVDMNPILLKPESDQRSQVIVHGKVWETLPARNYYTHKQKLWRAVTESLERLSSQYDLIIMEGAGSPVELNLKPGDLVNTAIARHAGAPCLLVGDIDRGGIFAQLLGTLWLLEPEERALIKGLVVNKFRGDIRLFEDGVRMLEERGGVPVLGVIPHIHRVGIAAEDAVVIDEGGAGENPEGAVLDIAVVHLPHISNFDDFDPLRLEPGVRLRYIESAGQFGQPDAVILPGTKSTAGDLMWLQASGLTNTIRSYGQRGGAVAGVCGGYQMLGTAVHDPGRAESDREEIPGLGLLPVATVFGDRKSTSRSTVRLLSQAGFLAAVTGETIEGYEIHMGQTETAFPLGEIIQREGQPVRQPDGAVSPNGRIFGSYLHGLFDNDRFRRAWLGSLGLETVPLNFRQARLEAFDRLADAVETTLDMAQLDQIIGVS